MRILAISIVAWALFTFLVNVSFAEAGPSHTSNDHMLEIYQLLRSLPFDNEKISAVQNLTLQKDRAKFTFESGTFHLSQPVLGKVTGAVFLGEGTFELKPPTEIERAQVRRFLEKDSLKETFSAAYFRFTDETANELIQRLEFHRGDIPKQVSEMHKDISKYFLEDRGLNLASLILSRLLNLSEKGFFIAVLEQQNPKHNFPHYFIFTIDPRSVEEVAGYQFFPHRVQKPFYTLCAFHQLSDYSQNGTRLRAGDENKDLVHINHYDMNLELEKNGNIKADVELTLTPELDSLQVLTFDFFKDLKIDSVQTSLGDALSFIKEKKEASFTVILKEPSVYKKDQKLRVYFSGKALKQGEASLILKDNLYWFPRYGYLVPATYDMTFKYPKSWQVVAGGKRTHQWEEDDSAFSIWVMEAPSPVAAFVCGIFDSTVYDVEDLFPIKIFAAKNRRRSVQKNLAGDVANSLYIFQKLLGDFPGSQLNIVERPSLISYSYPGTLFLTWSTFKQALEGVSEALRGHEVSHQWWGNLVGWKTYHDQWLSEAFAEYSGAMIAQFLLDGDKTFFQILNGWKSDLLEKGHVGVSIGLRRFGFSKANLRNCQGLEAGPIWLGYRLGDKHPIDYYLITYEKGAYVLHMLRMLMRDFDTNSDDRFWKMLADFVSEFRGQKATTQDFIRLVEEHLGEKMDWFFDQWLYGTEVPTYVYSYNISSEQGEYWVDLEVLQENVSPRFRMYIPVSVELEKEQKTTQLIFMQGAEKTFRLGPFPIEPEGVVFNDLEGVLARVKEK